MVRRVLCGSVVLVLSLACSGEFLNGVQAGLEEGVEQQFRETLIGACTSWSIGAEDTKLQKRACTCLADELIATKTPQELADLATSPSLAEVQPVLEACVKKLAGRGKP